jgi:hypothetical protein
MKQTRATEVAIASPVFQVVEHGHEMGEKALVTGMLHLLDIEPAKEIHHFSIVRVHGSAPFL